MYFGVKIKWNGKGINEYGYNEKTGKKLVKISKKYFRPAEVDTLLGDCTKAKNKLKWGPTYDIYNLIKEIVLHDLNNI